MASQRGLLFINLKVTLNRIGFITVKKRVMIMKALLFFKRIFLVFCCAVFFIGLLRILLSMRTPAGIRYTEYSMINLLRYKCNRCERGGVVPRSEYLSAYAKLSLKPLFFIHPTDKDEVVQEHIFRSDVIFYNYAEQVPVIGELFIEECYYFTAQKKDPLILDCGGNIGLATLYFKKYLYPQAKIIIFEPDPCNFSILQKNIARNSLTNVSMVNKALSNKKGKAMFYCDYKGSIGAHLIVKNGDDSAKSRDNDEKKKKSVECVLLSDYIDRPVDLLKLDIEGSEGLVLEDLEKTKKMKFIKEMIIEFHRDGARTLGYILSKLDVHSFSYSCYSINGGLTLMIHAFNKRAID